MAITLALWILIGVHVSAGADLRPPGSVVARCTARRGECPRFTGPGLARPYIIHFGRYRNASDHVSSVFSIEGDCSEWRIARRPPAVEQGQDPTDFVLLHVSRAGRASVLPRLIRHPSIRGVWPDRVVPRAPLSYYPGARAIHTIEGGGDDDVGSDQGASIMGPSRKILGYGLARESIAKFSGAEALWKEGINGRGVKVAVFDTGMRDGHRAFRHVRERTDWTDEDTLDDKIGHGTFVAGVISSVHKQCSGFAPDADVYVFRVFNKNKLSYTSWFLDAFNHAMHIGVDVLNLSIGGPDFLDQPFVDKVLEMSSNGIIVVSAIGNDGPRYGTLNNPADQLDVIGVGGITYSDQIARFSSRGMTTWELPRGYGRVKPDIVAYGKRIRGPNTAGGCRSLSGTSVASPVVAGMVTLLAQMADREYLNPAMMKQVLVESAQRVSSAHVFEQGMGKVDLVRAAELVAGYPSSPHASTIPPTLDLTDCPYMWPYCTQPLYYSQMPVIVNLTVLNPISVTGTLENAELRLSADGYRRGTPLLHADFTRSPLLWPWSGWLGVELRVTRAGIAMHGDVTGEIHFDVVSELGDRSHVAVPLRVRIQHPPPRERRLLWDQYHNLRYPSGYFPRDNLAVTSDILDWNGDHIHTNFKGLYDHLRAQGYYIEVLGRDWTCFDATNYGALLLVDPEEAYFEAEIDKLTADVYARGLSLVVVGEWHNAERMQKLRFLDQNTQSWWLPQTGGANIPELNRVLDAFHMGLSDRIVDARVSMGGGDSFRYESGTSIQRFPKGGYLYSVSGTDQVSGRSQYFPVIGIYSTGSRAQSGRIAVFGDSNCLDGSHRRGEPCYSLFGALLAFACLNRTDPALFPRNLRLRSSFKADIGAPPVRMSGVQFHAYSKVRAMGGGEKGRAECAAGVVGALPNISQLIRAANHSEYMPHLPAPGGGFHSVPTQRSDVIALTMVGAFLAVATYIRFCRDGWRHARLASRLYASAAGLWEQGSDVGTEWAAGGVMERPISNGSPKWRSGELHKRTNGATAGANGDTPPAGSLL